MIVLEMLMPEMDGKRCLEALRNMDPKVRVLITTGKTTQEMAEDLKEARAKGLIKKPFDMSELLEQMRKIIEE